MSAQRRPPPPSGRRSLSACASSSDRRQPVRARSLKARAASGVISPAASASCRTVPSLRSSSRENREALGLSLRRDTSLQGLEPIGRSRRRSANPSTAERVVSARLAVAGVFQRALWTASTSSRPSAAISLEPRRGSTCRSSNPRNSPRVDRRPRLAPVAALSSPNPPEGGRAPPPAPCAPPPPQPLKKAPPPAPDRPAPLSAGLPFGGGAPPGAPRGVERTRQFPGLIDRERAVFPQDHTALL